MPATDTTSLYQDYPHLRRIDELWGTRAARDFLKDLISDSRDGTREGFSLGNASTILKLLVEHDDLFPQFDDSLGFNSGDGGAGN